MTHFVDDEHFSALGIFRFYERKEAKNCWILYDKYEKSPSIPPPHRMLIWGIIQKVEPTTQEHQK